MAEEYAFTVNRAFTAAAVYTAPDGRTTPLIPAAVPFEGVRTLYASRPIETGGRTVFLYVAGRLPQAAALNASADADVRACAAALEAERAAKRAVLAALPGRLVPWFAANKRALPWRETTDPYCVWLSEIMLQQTRVAAAEGYYRRFVRALPDVQALAACPDDTLMKLWEGLGYYSRARNLKKAAQLLSAQGGFPTTRAGWAALPGVGDYTAGAIVSIAFGRPEAAVDGNVLRVAARALECFPATADAGWKKALSDALSAVYPSGACGDFTQSFMDLASLVCLPASPRCDVCPLSDLCLSRARGTIARLPVRPAKRTRPTETHTVFVLRCAGRYALRRRGAGILSGQWEFPNADGLLDEAAAGEWLKAHAIVPDGAVIRTAARHVFTHRVWDMRVYVVPCAAPAGPFTWLDISDTGAALPSAFRACLEGVDLI